jgi:cell wall-associated NlpC family hydrolase
MSKGLKILIVSIILISSNSFSQQKIIRHSIKKGETLSSLANRFDVKQSEIVKLNPNSNKKLKINSILLIPTVSNQIATSENNIKVKNANQLHQVQQKETLYGIAKQYGISVNDLISQNPALSSELKIGQIINLPETTTAIKNLTPSSEDEKVAEAKINKSNAPKSTTFKWEVLSKETKYSLTKKYGITIKEFDGVNPKLGTKLLRVGQIVNIPQIQEAVVQKESNEYNNRATNIQSHGVDSSKLAINDSGTAINAVQEIKSNNTQTITYTVLPKETKYGIAKQYGLTLKELEKQNPEIKNVLAIGKELSITYPKANGAESTLVNIETINNLPVVTSTFDFNNALSSEVLDRLIERASQNLGSRYRTGGTSKSGFDCSGLIYTTFGECDIQLPRTSKQQSRVGVVINTEEAQKGDLIFFKTNGRRQINHVGMVVEVNDDEIKFIHSSTSNGVIISSTKERYYGKNFSQINRVIH